MAKKIYRTLEELVHLYDFVPPQPKEYCYYYRKFLFSKRYRCEIYITEGTSKIIDVYLVDTRFKQTLGSKHISITQGTEIIRTISQKINAAIRELNQLLTRDKIKMLCPVR